MLILSRWVFRGNKQKNNLQIINNLSLNFLSSLDSLLKAFFFLLHFISWSTHRTGRNKRRREWEKSIGNITKAHPWVAFHSLPLRCRYIKLIGLSFKRIADTSRGKKTLKLRTYLYTHLEPLLTLLKENEETSVLTVLCVGLEGNKL